MSDIIAIVPREPEPTQEAKVHALTVEVLTKMIALAQAGEIVDVVAVSWHGPADPQIHMSTVAIRPCAAGSPSRRRRPVEREPNRARQADRHRGPRCVCAVYSAGNGWRSAKAQRRARAVLRRADRIAVRS